MGYSLKITDKSKDHIKSLTLKARDLVIICQKIIRTNEGNTNDIILTKKQLNFFSIYETDNFTW